MEQPEESDLHLLRGSGVPLALHTVKSQVKPFGRAMSTYVAQQLCAALRLTDVEDFKVSLLSTTCRPRAILS
jgi:hypothetical protein